MCRSGGDPGGMRFVPWRVRTNRSPETLNAYICVGKQMSVRWPGMESDIGGATVKAIQVARHDGPEVLHPVELLGPGLRLGEVPP